MRKAKKGFVFVVAWLCPAGLSLQAGLAQAPPLPQAPRPLVRGVDPTLFPLPPALEPNVRFWITVFSRVHSNQALIHDEEHLDVIYGVVNLPPMDSPGVSETTTRRKRQDLARRAQDRIRALLRKLASSPEAAAEDEELRRLRDLLLPLPGGRNKYLAAAQRVRSQTGLKDKFAEAVGVSGRYLPALEEIFRKTGVPRELTRLPFVESMFVSRSRSYAGAVGAWQFTAATGRLYLDIGPALDARVDVLLAGQGAARLLKGHRQRLGTWPLAVTAYNHGRAGMLRAVRRLGTRDLGVIVTKYRSRTFGFASQNFYSEFLAAADVYANRRTHFPGSEPEPPLAFDELALSQYTSLPALARQAGATLDELEALNPALKEEVFDGTLLVPKGYPLRLPEGSRPTFAQAYESLAPPARQDSQIQTRYRVRRGDTLSVIARRFDTTVRTLQRMNHLQRPDRIVAGQVLTVPRGRVATTPTAKARPTSGVHRVRPGQTLTQVAALYGIPTRELIQANDLTSPDRLLAGQELRIPGGRASSSQGEENRRHVVKKGENLFQIARIYGTSVDVLKALNQLAADLIWPGQVLIVP